ncbi:8124_t:CDS:2 [Ambispora leptoticha]|uniref:acetylornithine transaminase n=1 Tax=Ambispora leptoticha TaxID=144679 RepID=A0A9N9H2C2_9GLOM|nr:8124_t:CDS:2 [Ambispora leptoticha]
MLRSIVRNLGRGGVMPQYLPRSGSSRVFGISAIRWNSIESATNISADRGTANVDDKRWVQSGGNPKPTHPDADTHPIAKAILDRHSQYLLNTYARPPLIFTHGNGCYLYDYASRQYLDFTAGIAVNGLGHADPQLSEIVHDQTQRLIHLSNLYHNEYAGELAEVLIKATRENDGFDAAKVFFSNSGTEANEGALKFARKWGKYIAKEIGVDEDEKYRIVSFINGFHGRSMGALSATPAPKYQKPFSPLIPGCSYAPFNDVTKINEFVTPETCAAIVEPIQGEGGVFEASIEFLEALKARCQEVGALLIYDEIQCGLGRTGKLWAHQNLPKSCHPDILTMAKPMANGLPIGGIMVTNRVADLITIGDHGTTFGGNPLACRAGIYVVSRINTPELLGNVNTVGTYLRTSLENLSAKHPSLITEIRGRGLILGMQFSRDPTPLVQLARERGLLIITAGNNTVRIVPPLILTKDQASHGVKIIEEAVELFEKEVN